MRYPRLKDGEGWYHLQSRTVNGEFLFGDVEREMLRKHIWLVAVYCGIQIITATPMGNHFHVTVRVPAPAPVRTPSCSGDIRCFIPRSAAGPDGQSVRHVVGRTV